MKIIALFLIFIQSAMAQLNTLQSDSDIKWLKVENDNFQVIFPDYLESEGHYTLNLLEHYRDIVGKTYKSQPEKLSIVIRPHINQPNGFVTLAPRRSEWFNQASLTPLIGSLEFLQALAVHEYRHVVQFDVMKQGNMLYPYYLFGEGFLSFFMNFIMPTWYFEGDATWAETVYSDSGRGRSPRFSARFKAMLLSENAPKYDDLLAGDFTTEVPNHYVFGYFLVTRAINLYGDDVWNKIVQYAVQRPWNVYAVYSGFEAVTGKDFDEFYDETILELKEKWKEESDITLAGKNEKYASEVYPLEEGFYLYRDLDSLWQLKKGDRTITELNISPGISRIDKKFSKIIFTSLLPDKRFDHKSYSDLYEYDLTLDRIKPLSGKQRYYHPQFSPDGIKFVATHIDDKDNFSLHIFERNKFKRKITSTQKYHRFAEAVWRNNDELIILALDEKGKKYLAHYFLSTNEIVNLTMPTRNNIYSLHFYQDQVLFEADYLGTTNIFSYSLAKNTVSQCTKDPIGAFQPRVIDNKLYYSSEKAQGKRITYSPIQCDLLAENEIFNRYLGSSPSDTYTNTSPIEIKDYKKLREQTLMPGNYYEYGSALSPHSWQFFGGRGVQLLGQGNNILGSLGLTGYTGMTSEESQPFAGLSFTYSKFYPLFTFGVDYLQRKETVSNLTSEWTELRSFGGIIFPYTHVLGVYRGQHLLGLQGQYIALSENNYTVASRLNDDSLVTKGFTFSSRLEKFTPARNLQSPLGYNLNFNYLDIEQDQTNYLANTNLEIKLPGLMSNDGFRLNAVHEYRIADINAYNLLNNYVSPIGYTFSRGYAYEFSRKFSKLTAEYLTPLAYPRWGIWDWIYFTRISGRVFFDTTSADIFVAGDSYNERTFNSTGLQFLFDTSTFRKFNIRYRLGAIQTLRDHKFAPEFFIEIGRIF